MKRLLIMLLILSFPFIALAAEEKAKKPVAQCPETLMVESCLKCHVPPDFKLKERNPKDYLSLPNPYTNIIMRNSKPMGFFYLTDINSNNIQDAFEYWHTHGIDYAVIEIHSPGGSLFDAARIVGIIDSWKRNGMTVETDCKGFALSAGFMVFISGSEGFRLVSKKALLMWHELISFSMFSIETPSDKEDASRVLRFLQNNENNYIADHCNLDKKTIDELVYKKEWWMTGQEAVEKYGIADGYLD